MMPKLMLFDVATIWFCCCCMKGFMGYFMMMMMPKLLLLLLNFVDALVVVLPIFPEIVEGDEIKEMKYWDGEDEENKL